MILPSIEYQVSEKTNENLDVSFGAAVSRLESEDKHAPSHTLSASDSPQIEYHHGVTPYKPDEPNPRGHLPAAFPILHTAGSFGPKMIPYGSGKSRVHEPSVIPSMTMHIEGEVVPGGWTACRHPDGQLYFWHEAKKLYTDAHLYNPKVYSLIERFANHLYQVAQEKNMVLPLDAELVLDLRVNGTCGYYFVMTSLNTLFWIHDFDITWYVSREAGVASPSKDRLARLMEYVYWLHLRNFPHGHSIPHTRVRELTGRITNLIIGVLTGPSSDPPERARMEEMLTLVPHLDDPDHHRTCALAKAMCYFTFGDFMAIEDIGEVAEPKLEPNPRPPPSIGTVRLSSRVVHIIFAMLLFAPADTMRLLKALHASPTGTRAQHWTPIVEQLKIGWQESTVFATVLLNANVAFLAIPDVIGSDFSRTPAQVASLISVASSIGSVLMGLFLLGRYRIDAEDSARDLANFRTFRKPSWGTAVEHLAVVYALPYALLMWGMLTFLVALSAECFSTHDTVSLTVTGVAWAVIAIIILWYFYGVWAAGEPHPTALEDPNRPVWGGLKHIFGRLLRCMRGKLRGNRG
ncbi:unnamed protein product [Somion occarium]|uniref:Uncharacterized protein n=1 Tax=Somion occarium TaxID=3059160 RepID=A0ABP1CUK2_9APHY